MKRFPSAVLFLAGSAFAVVAFAAGDRAPGSANGSPANGAQVYSRWCAPCHARGPGHPGTQSLEVKYRGKNMPAALEDRTDLSPPVTAYFVRNGVALMPQFRKTEISDAELRDLAAYLAAKK